MRITRWGEYGILCCLYLASKHEDNHALGAAEIAESQNIPLQYAQQILHRLRKGGIIKSSRGPHGGFRLAKGPEDTNLKDVLYAAEGTTLEVICQTDPVYPNLCSSASACGLKDVWMDLKQAIDQVLEKQTLAIIMKKHTNFNHQALVPSPSRAPVLV